MRGDTVYVIVQEGMENIFPVVDVYDDRLDAVRFMSRQAHAYAAAENEDIEVEYDLTDDNSDEIVAGDFRCLVMEYPVQ